MSVGPRLGRLALVTALLAAAVLGAALAASRASCERARGTVVQAAIDRAPGLGDRVDAAIAACPDGADRLALARQLLERPRPPAADAARAVARAAVGDEPRRYEARLAALLAARPGAERARALAALRRIDPLGAPTR